jgi:hypothetical protein
MNRSLKPATVSCTLGREAVTRNQTLQMDPPLSDDGTVHTACGVVKLALVALRPVSRR